MKYESLCRKNLKLFGSSFFFLPTAAICCFSFLESSLRIMSSLRNRPETETKKTFPSQKEEIDLLTMFYHRQRQKPKIISLFSAFAFFSPYILVTKKKEINVEEGKKKKEKTSFGWENKQRASLSLVPALFAFCRLAVILSGDFCSSCLS